MSLCDERLRGTHRQEPPIQKACVRLSSGLRCKRIPSKSVINAVQAQMSFNILGLGTPAAHPAALPAGIAINIWA